MIHKFNQYNESITDQMKPKELVGSAKIFFDIVSAFEDLGYINEDLHSKKDGYYALFIDGYDPDDDKFISIVYKETEETVNPYKEFEEKIGWTLNIYSGFKKGYICNEFFNTGEDVIHRTVEILYPDPDKCIKDSEEKIELEKKQISLMQKIKQMK